MIILLSPAKTFTKDLENGNSFPVFKNKSEKIINVLNKMDFSSLQKTLKTSDNLTNNAFDYYKNYKLQYIAVYLYGGQAYKYLKAREINRENLRSLYILCPLYGVLNALDNISFYRLDIKDKVLDISFYDYWYDDINNYLNSLNKNIIINLSSGEFSRLLDLDNEKIITINFGTIKDGKLSQPSMLIKKMRGMMANHLLTNNIKGLKGIKNMEIDGFKLNKEHSTNNLLFFTKNV